MGLMTRRHSNGCQTWSFSGERRGRGSLALIIVWQAIQRQANLLVNRPAELAALEKALAAGLQVAANAFEQVFSLQGALADLEASRTSTDGDCTENNPLDQALEAWTKNRP
jgi:hypothetical protein